MVQCTDVTIAVTDYLRDLHPAALQSKIHVVHDGIEHPDHVKTEWTDHSGSWRRPLRAVLVTSAKLMELPVLKSPPSWLQVTIVGRYSAARDRVQRLRELWWGMNEGESTMKQRIASVRFLLNERIQLVAWDLVRVYQCMRDADIGIIPVDCMPEARPGESPPPWLLKSENRLTLKMCMGLPVVATPIPSYEHVVQHGRNAFLARSAREWLDCLDALRDPRLRRDVGQRARTSVLDRYSIGEQARRLLGVLEGVVAATGDAVDIAAG